MEHVRFLRRWVLIGLLHFAAALGLGLFMVLTHDRRLSGVLLQLGLLGWVSSVATSFVYRLFPAAAATRGARLHLWLYHLALPVMALGLAGLLLGRPAFEPLLVGGSVGMLAAVLLFGLTIFCHAGIVLPQRSGAVEPPSSRTRPLSPRPRPAAARP